MFARETYCTLVLTAVVLLISDARERSPVYKRSTKKNERGDSGLYSEDTIVSTNDCVYSSSCHVENKHFENVEETNTKTVESYEDFIANLPLPVTEFNKTVRKVFRCLLN